MFKVIFITCFLGVCVANPTGIGGYGFGGHGAYGVSGYGGLSSGVSTSSRADVFGPAVAYSAGAPYSGAIALPHGINAGITHVSRTVIPNPIIGAVSYGGLGYGGYGGHGLGGHY